MRIVKGIKDIGDSRSNDKIADRIHASIPDNASDLKRYCIKNTFSILKSIPKPTCANYGHIENVSAEEPMRYALLIRSPITMLNPDNIEKDISKMTKNMIGHRKGIRKELIELATNIQKSNAHINRVKKGLFF